MKRRTGSFRWTRIRMDRSERPAHPMSVSDEFMNISENLIRTQARHRNSWGNVRRMAQFLVDRSEERPEVLRGLASPLRVQILKLLHNGVGVSVNDIASALELPQSTVSSNLQVLEQAGLIRAENAKGQKGNQKLCFSKSRGLGDVPGGYRGRLRERHRRRDADRALHQLRSERAVRPLLADRHHRAVGRSGTFSIRTV